MRFIDANVFVYAYIIPREKIGIKNIKLRNNSKKIIERINNGEKAITSIVHISEVANVLEEVSTHDKVSQIVLDILTNDNIEVVPVSRESYAIAADITKEYNIGVNDCLAYYLMQNMSISEIYTFDRDFDKLKGIKRIEE